MGDHADTRPGRARLADHVPAGSTRLYPDEWQSSQGSHPFHAPVRHGVQAWAWEAEGEGIREGHGHTCEGAGAALRTYRRAFREVHQRDLPLDGATYEAIIHAKRVTPALIQRLCFGTSLGHAHNT